MNGRKASYAVIILVIVAWGLLLSGNNGEADDCMTIDECYELLSGNEHNEKLTKASQILMRNDQFNLYLRDNIVPYNGSINTLDLLMNTMFFTDEEQTILIDGLSLLNGLLFIKYGGSNNGFLLFEIQSEDHSRILLYYFPAEDGNAEMILSKGKNIAYISQNHNITIMNENWAISLPE